MVSISTIQNSIPYLLSSKDSERGRSTIRHVVRPRDVDNWVCRSSFSLLSNNVPAVKDDKKVTPTSRLRQVNKDSASARALRDQNLIVLRVFLINGSRKQHVKYGGVWGFFVNDLASGCVVRGFCHFKYVLPLSLHISEVSACLNEPAFGKHHSRLSMATKRSKADSEGRTQVT